MSTEQQKIFAGAGAFIVSRSGKVLTVEELNTSERTAKIAGMKSHPMESLEDGETILSCLSRVFEEEVNFLQAQPIDQIGHICDVQITPTIRVKMFGFRSEEEWPIKIGTAKAEVTNPRWVPVEEILNARVGSDKFRVGVRETAGAFKLYTASQTKFEPVYFSLTADYQTVVARIRNHLTRSESSYQSPFPLKVTPGVAV